MSQLVWASTSVAVTGPPFQDVSIALEIVLKAVSLCELAETELRGAGAVGDLVDSRVAEAVDLSLVRRVPTDRTFVSGLCNKTFCVSLLLHQKG